MGRTGVIDVGARGASAQLEAVQQLEEVARFLDLEKWIVQRLQHAEREVSLNLQIGERSQARIFRATRILHSSVRGPGMGPLAFSRTVPGDIVTGAMERSWQYALWNLPFCGSAGAITADLEELSERETRLLSRAYVRGLRDVLGPNRDVITAEREMFPQVMAWASSAMGSADRESLGGVTGKPVAMGGVDGQGIAARFLRLLMATVLRQAGITPTGASVAFFGFDPLARRCAIELERAGARVIAVADQSGALLEKSGLNVAALAEHTERERMIFGFPEAEAVSHDDVIDLACDVLMVCGPQDLLRTSAARFVFEAGGQAKVDPVNRTQVVPSLLADCGLSFASFCEWRKGCAGGVAEGETLRGLASHIRSTWREVYEYAEKHEWDLRRAALATGVSRMAEALRMR